MTTLSVTKMWIATLFLLILLLLLYPGWRRRAIIRTWRNKLALDKCLSDYQQLVANVNGFLLSQEARVGHDAMEYTYGEIDFISFIAVFSLTNPDSETVFYDLGSGIGKAVLACSMVFNVKKSCGIELFDSLHRAALQQREQLQQLPDYLEKAKTIHFIHADFLKTSFHDATHVFINATALFGETWLKLTQHLLQVKPETILLTTSKKLPSETFELIKTTTAEMSWGIVRVYIHQRIE